MKMDRSAGKLTRSHQINACSAEVALLAMWDLSVQAFALAQRDYVQSRLQRHVGNLIKKPG